MGQRDRSSRKTTSASIRRPVYISLGVEQRLMQRGPRVGIEPVTWVERDEFNLGAFRQVGRFVYDQATGANSGLERHVITLTPVRVGDKAMASTGNGCVVPVVNENWVRPSDGVCERKNRCGGVRRRCGKIGDRRWSKIPVRKGSGAIE